MAITLLQSLASLSQFDFEENSAQFYEWFEGEFDNFQQVWTEEKDSVVDSLRHEHIHSIFKEVKFDKLDGRIFFVKQYIDGDTTDVYRQRIYNFFPNQEEQALQLNIYSFISPEQEKKYGIAHYQPEILNELKLEDLRTSGGCEVYWIKQGDEFIGYMKERACNFVSRRSGKRIFITDSLSLTSDQIWISDKAEDENGSYVFGHRGGVPHKLKKCRKFEGWMAVQKTNQEDAYYFMRNIKLHDQGKKVRLVDMDGTTTNYSVELSEVIYSGGLEVLKLAIYEYGKDKAVAYVWTNPDAKRIGINMRSITAGFTLVE